MTWYGNFSDRSPARFCPHDGQPETVWPGRGFNPDSFGGAGADNVTGSRYDVLARDNPAWAAAVLAAAVAANMPLQARRIGSAGKYRFWVLCHASPAEAETWSLAARAASDARRAASDVATLSEHYRLGEGELLISADGERLPAVAVQVDRRGYNGLLRRWLDAAGSIHRIPDGAAIVDRHGCQAWPDLGRDAHAEPAEHADAAWWSATLDAQIEAARAAKRAAKQASAATVVAGQNSLTAAFARARRTA